MNKNTLFLKLVLLFLLPFPLFFLSGCASTQVGQGTDGEPWIGKLTGMIDADLKMFFSRVEEEKDIYLVNGTFKGDIGRVSGEYGSGKMNGKIKGKVKDGIFNVRISGNANVRAGSATIDGKMIGTLSKTQVFGTWNIIARDTEGTLYEFSGEWNAEKVDS
jgi:hypothetical protein